MSKSLSFINHFKELKIYKENFVVACTYILLLKLIRVQSIILKFFPMMYNLKEHIFL